MIRYHVAYVGNKDGMLSFGRTTVEMDNPISSGDDLSEIEQGVIDRNGLEGAVVLGFYRMEGSDDDVMERALDNPDEEMRELVSKIADEA